MQVVKNHNSNILSKSYGIDEISKKDMHMKKLKI